MDAELHGLPHVRRDVKEALLATLVPGVDIAGGSIHRLKERLSLRLQLGKGQKK